MRDEVVNALPVVTVGQRVAPGVHGQGQTGLEELARVGPHPVQVAHAQVMVLGAGPAHAAVHPVPFRVPVGPTEDHGGGAGAQGQGGELLPQVVGGGGGLGQAPEGRLLDLPGALRVDQQDVVGLAGVDHGAGQLHAVDETQAGVGQVEVQAAGRQPQLVVHGDRGGRLQVGPGNRGVDHHADLGGVDAGLGQRLGPGHRRRVGEGDVLGPPASLADPGQLLDHPRATCRPAHRWPSAARRTRRRSPRWAPRPRTPKARPCCSADSSRCHS